MGLQKDLKLSGSQFYNSVMVFCKSLSKPPNGNPTETDLEPKMLATLL